MRMWRAIITVAVWMVIQGIAAQVREPPSISSFETIPRPTGRIVYAVVGVEVRITCTATGTPEAEFEWLKNDELMNTNQDGVSSRIRGSLVFPDWKKHIHDGYYQCMASNQNGKALSDKRQLVSTDFYKKDSSDVVKQYQATEGEPLMLPCGKVVSIPDAWYSWTTSAGKDGHQEPVPLSTRTTMDEAGNLYFAYARLDDAHPERSTYRLIYRNDLLGITFGSSYSTIVFNENPGNPTYPVEKRYTTADLTPGSPLIGLVGENLMIKCIFAGKPEPIVTWGRRNGNIANTRKNVTEFTTLLILKNVQPSDEDTYWCRGSNAHSDQTEEIQVEIYSVPNFVDDKDKPMDKTITEGEDAVFHCNAEAKPQAAVEWLVNGKTLTDEDTKPNERFRLSGDRRKLTIPNTCKTCSGHSSDLMVVHCNASNPYGYAFATGFLNVVERTVIIEAPEARVELDSYREVVFPCKAISDPGTRVEIYWKHGDDFIRYDPGKQVWNPDTNRLHIYTNQKGGEKFAGIYTCIADNEYSQDNVTVELILPKGALPSRLGLQSLYTLQVGEEPQWQFVREVLAEDSVEDENAASHLQEEPHQQLTGEMLTVEDSEEDDNTNENADMVKQDPCLLLTRLRCMSYLVINLLTLTMNNREGQELKKVKGRQM